MTLKNKAYDHTQRFVIALDGPSAVGKGLIGSMIAKEFNLKYVQSSLVYRGLAYICLSRNISCNDVDSIIKLSSSENIIDQVQGVDLNLEEIGIFASNISTIPKVRDNLGKYLLHLIKETPRIIMEGRDIGTIIAPNADLKIFLTADAEIRATRRFKQLQEEGKDCILSDVLNQMQLRDLQDSSRSAAPLKAADDAKIIDTSNATPDEVLFKIKNFIS
jgi:CMP/dCMP kinase